MADSQSGRSSTVFVKENQICQSARVGALDEVRQDQGSSV